MPGKKDAMMTRLVDQLKRHEGFRGRPYWDSLGIWTIGYGFTSIRRDEAEVVLRMKIARLEKLLETRLQGLDDTRRQVLLNMAYNLGVKRLLGFYRMWAAIERVDYELAALEMMDSKWARQVGPRAEELAGMMRRG